jgi:para-aminobenzoate synthetase
MRILSSKIPLRTKSSTIFGKLYGGQKYAYWLDSSSEATDQGRFSFMGDATGPYARILSYAVRDRTLTIRAGNAEGAKCTTLHADLFDWLKADLAGYSIAPLTLPFDFRLGWVGYLGYELKALCGGDDAHRAPFPDAVMLFSSRAIAIDHVEKTINLLALVDEKEERPQAEQEEWMATACDTILELSDEPQSTSDTQAPDVSEPLRARLRHDKNAYLSLIARSRDEIRQGESYEICLTNMVFGEMRVDPWRSYLALRSLSPTALSAWFAAGDVWVLSSSPERFMKVSPTGHVESKPIKGTRPRGATKAEDERIKEGLIQSEKERAENLMIVDLVRNDIGSCAQIGSVSVPKLFDIESYSTVHQMVSTVIGKLKPTMTAIDVVRASFPGGSMTGAPKKRTMEIIDRLEGGYRGIYSGALGYFSLNGAADLSIVIRTAVVTKDVFSVGIGGAITYLSDSGEEFEETVVKSKAILGAFNAKLVEHTHVDPARLAVPPAEAPLEARLGD